MDGLDTTRRPDTSETQQPQAPGAAGAAAGGARGALRGLSYREGAAALAPPKPGGQPPQGGAATSTDANAAEADVPVLTEAKLAKARSYYSSKAAFWPPAQVQRVAEALGIATRDAVDDEFIQAAGAYQKREGLSPIDGMVGGGTLVALNSGPEMKRAYEVGDKITSKYEGGSYGSLQTVDAGIVSYGKHQTTLASGNLAKLLDLYLAKAKAHTPVSAAATTLEGYVSKVKGSAKDKEALRGDSTFTGALKTAAAEDAMHDAQDEFFYDAFWVPAVKLALKYGVTSQLGYATVYDCTIQGGASASAEGARASLGGIVGAVSGDKTITEKDFLVAFNKAREGRLERIAKAKEGKGLTTDAAMLRTSKARPQAFKELAEAGNLDLSSNVDGQSELELGTYHGARAKIAVPAQVASGGQADLTQGGDVPATGAGVQPSAEPQPQTNPAGVKPEGEGPAKGSASETKTVDPTTAADAGSSGSQGPAVTGHATVTASKLNVRSAPNTDTAPVGKVTSGTRLGTTGVTDGAWVQVVFQGRTAWVHGNFVDAGGGAAATTAGTGGGTSANAASTGAAAAGKAAQGKTSARAPAKDAGSGYFSHPDADKVSVSYGAHAVALNATAEHLLKSLLASAGLTSGHVSSTLRTYADQARINYEQNTGTQIKKWYGQAVYDTWAKYKREGKTTADYAAYLEQRDKDRGRVISNHIPGYALDVSPYNGAFASAVQKQVPVSGSGVRKRIVEKGCTHVEFTFHVT